MLLSLSADFFPLNFFKILFQEHYQCQTVWIQIRPKVIKLIPCSTQPSMKFIQLINVKMPTIVGILTFISMINTTS